MSSVLPGKHRAWFNRVPAGVQLGLTVALAWSSGCSRDWNAYDPRLGSGGQGTGGGQASSSGASSSGSTSSSGSASSSGASSSGATSSSSASSSTSASSSSSSGAPCGTTGVLADDFNGTDPSALWTVSVSGGAAAALTGGEAVFTLPSASPTPGFASFVTHRYYDLRNSSISVEVTAAGNVQNSAASRFRVQLTGNTNLTFIQQHGTLSCFQMINGTQVTLRSLPYSPTDHRFWRFREDGTNVYWEASSDGVSWALLTQATTASLFSLAFVQVALLGQTNGGEVSPGPISFDRVNGGGTPTAKWCPASSLTDDFGQSARSPAWLRTYTQPAATAAQTGGQLVITVNPNAVGNTGYVSSASFDLTGSSLVVQVPQTTNPSTYASTYIALGAVGNNALQMKAENGQLSFLTETGGAYNVLGSVLYDATKHAWWRLRESGGTIFFEASPDGMAWTGYAQASPPPFPLDALDIYLVGGTSVAVPSPGASHFDNVNLPPP